MQYLIFKKYNNSYSIKSGSKTNLWNLGSFLEGDFCQSNKFFIEWLKSVQKETAGNYSWLEKWDNNVLIGCLYDSEERMYEYAFSIDKDEFIKVLNKWQELYKQKPNEIHITFENGKITMEGKD